MTSISATFNAIHPDLKQGEADTQRACRLIECGRKMGTSIVTLCTGTRHPPGHVATTSGQSDSTRLTGHGAERQRLVEVAKSSGVVLGIEPEKGNVVDSAAKARRVLQKMQSPHLKIIMDGANLCEAEDLPRMQTVLEEAFHFRRLMWSWLMRRISPMTPPKLISRRELDWVPEFP
ncbi:MAG: hypothetical protein EXQ58_07950 [Acidobacteria bacterium]|nr:hypothetical protein [Acidobacteriota bacterium]